MNVSGSRHFIPKLNHKISLKYVITNIQFLSFKDLIFIYLNLVSM